jgi:hypothetical protein
MRGQAMSGALCGPTADKIRGLLSHIGLEDSRAETLILTLAGEIDRLRDRLDDHVEAEDGRHNYTRSKL